MTAKQSNDYSPTPLHHLVFVLQHLSEELLNKEVKVGLSQARIMGALDSKTPSSQSAVASQLRQTEANVSRQLHAMQKSGLVRITKNKKDSRQRDVTLTSKGTRKYQQAEKLLKKQQSRLLNKNEAAVIEKLAQKF